MGKKWIRREKRGGSVRDKNELDEQGRTVPHNSRTVRERAVTIASPIGGFPDPELQRALPSRRKTSKPSY